MTSQTDTSGRVVNASALLADAESRSIALRDLRVDPRLSCRKQLDPRRIRLMREALRSGAAREPLVVAIIDGVITLVDGHHRFHALKGSDFGRTDVLVLREIATHEEARWVAYWLHWKAAKPLSRKERREGFKAYVAAGKHLATRFGRLKTYRGIAEDLGLAVTTLHRWMGEEFPRIAAKMSRSPEDDGRGSAAKGDPSQRALRDIKHHAGQIALIGRAAEDRVAQDAREALLAALKALGDRRTPEELLDAATTGDYDF